MNYTVTTDAADLDDALARLWGTDPTRRFRWYYRENPHGPGRVLLLSCARSPGLRAFVGCAGIGARIVQVNGTPRSAAQLTDLGIEREHRTVMPALKLTRAVLSQCRNDHAFSYGFANEHSIGVYRRIGYREVGKITRYALVLRHAHYARRALPHAKLAEAAGFLLDLPSRAARRVCLIRQPELEWVHDTDERFDALWNAAKDRHPVVESRSAKDLRWRYFQHPSRVFHTAILPNGTNRIRAYVILERIHGVASIWDLFGESDDAVETLLDRVAQTARAWGDFALSIHVAGSRLADVVASCGFRARESAKTLVIDPSHLTFAERTTVLDAASWYVANGGEDN